MSEDLKPGTVRVTGALTAHQSRVEVWTGEAWLTLKGVVSAAWQTSVEEGRQLSRLSLELHPYITSELLAAPDLVSLRIAGVTDEMLAAARMRIEADKAAAAEA